ncbi:hypothetical protein [Thiomicrorhabdus aquaedulcis]|uniref:hypothetical protein n=1 Tax=Thiomicrorhabdus aquaedulcis TaxID=2211106 RepID=UPI000FD99D2D|nr:hypothetical protein [Thiomicrorhabdus aquaedulcis]
MNQRKSNGLRQKKQPTAKELMAANQKLMLENDRLKIESAMLKLDIRNRSANFLTQSQVFEGILREAIYSASTIGEARRWYSQWVKDISAVDVSDPNCEALIKEVIDRHGFEIKIDDHYAEVDAAWESQREERLSSKT